MVFFLAGFGEAGKPALAVFLAPYPGSQRGGFFHTALFKLAFKGGKFRQGSFATQA